jgi:anti-sigma28 factor (negative regulator of flagellin synthesis)
MKMNTKNLIAALAVLAASGSVFANDVSGLNGAQATDNYVVGGKEFVAPDAGFVSTKTRQQVVAELQQAEADGSYAQAQKEFVAPDAGFASTKTREQVVAELKQAEADGSYALSQQEFDGQVRVAGTSTSRLAGSAKAANLH